MSHVGPSQSPSKAPKSCWTCKERKVGCDRALPACNNCSRTSRHCSGYGIRLQWHEKIDGRRKNALTVPKSFTPLQNNLCRDEYGKHFINFSAEDIIIAMESRHLSLKLLQLTRLPQQIQTMPSLADKDSLLLTYYESQVAPMISTLDLDNGFKSDLLPMALSTSEAAAVGLRNAMMAVAAFHSANPLSALPYKIRAIRSLSCALSMRATDALSLKTQLATSMMLCVHNVFDESETDWLVHLVGARRILSLLAGRELHSSMLSFLSSLFYYHYVLGDFVRPVSSRNFIYPSCQLEGRETTILGPLGCSLELLQIVHQVTQLRSHNADVTYDDDHAVAAHLDLAAKLRSLRQDLHVSHQGDKNSTRDQALLTAELYRLGALLYLYTVCSGLSDSAERNYTVDQALGIVQEMAVCTSPWPLFILAGEVTTDSQRVRILEVLDRMGRLRRIGNIFVVRQLIEAHWKQLDLSEGEQRPRRRPRIWESLNPAEATPWFI